MKAGAAKPHIGNLFVLVLVVLSVRPVRADITLPEVFSNNMILQREKRIAIWGQAGRKEKVRLTVGPQKAIAIADEKGSWTVNLAPMPAGGPYNLTIKGSNTVIIRNVLLGDVWLCSGQSNMGIVMRKSIHKPEDIDKANYPSVRFFIPKKQFADRPQKNLCGRWFVCNPENTQFLPAVQYYFAREIHRTIAVPVGIIEASYGGSPIPCWISEQALNGRIEDDFGYPHSALYNAVISPLAPISIAGILWYQGEADVNRATRYLPWFNLLVDDWRKTFRQGNIPFLFAQLANYGPKENSPASSHWAELREVQAKGLSIPNTFMTVNIDADPGYNATIHSPYKYIIGHRLAELALHVCYHKPGHWRYPVFNCMEIKQYKAILRFRCINKALSVHGAKLEGFSIAGSDKTFLPAEAKLIDHGTEIMVWNKNIKSPVAVRYAWADNPKCNVYSADNLPMTPFRTDKW